MDIIKNPIVIAILAGAITYVYLSRDSDENYNKKKNKKSKKEINLAIPLVVAVIVWFLAYSYFEYNIDNTQQINHNIMTGGNLMFGDQIVDHKIIPLPVQHSKGHKFIGDIISDSSSAKSFSLLPTNGTVTIPKELPDVLLRME